MKEIVKSAPKTVTAKASVELHEAQEVSATRHSASKHVILLHGWAHSSSGMKSVLNGIRRLPSSRSWTFWNCDFPINKRFKEGAEILAAQLGKTGRDFRNTIFVCYSMGGVVARQMIADGFPCKAVVTICTPHQGVAPWLPTPGDGVMSIHPLSHDLAALNNNARDKRARKNYYFFGITYNDVNGKHNDDQVVLIESALGYKLGATAHKEEMPLNYPKNSAAPAFDPHWKGYDARYIAPVLSTVDTLLQRY